jgi:signal transduction histidine kinase
MTGLALDSQLTNEQHTYVEASLNCAESLLSIVNNILDFTKIEAGKMEVENTTFNLRDVVEQTANILGIKADEKDLEIIVNYPTSFHECFIGDSTRIRQVRIITLVRT